MAKMTSKNSSLSSSTSFYSNSVQSVSTQKFIDMCHVCGELKQTIQNCGSRLCCCYVLVVGQHLPEHGQPRHLHAAALSLPRAAETRSPSPELQARCQQYGGQVGSFHMQSLRLGPYWYEYGVCMHGLTKVVLYCLPYNLYCVGGDVKHYSTNYSTKCYIVNSVPLRERYITCTIIMTRLLTSKLSGIRFCCFHGEKNTNCTQKLLIFEGNSYL